MTFPSWRYGPDGAAEIFEHEEDVPAGWVDHPAKLAKEQAVNAALAKFDHDGDGMPGGSKPKAKRGVKGKRRDVS
jgi:hypothetical protein